jgi:hypothetical protein
VTKATTIGKLEALLNRVLTRSVARRDGSAVSAPPGIVSIAPEESPGEDVPDEPTIPPPPFAPPQAVAPQAAPAPSPAAAAQHADAEPAISVDISDAGPDIIIGESTTEEMPLDEVSEGGRADSRERLVAAEPVEPNPDAGAGLPIDLDDDLDAGENEEQAPASSRRPVAPPPEERLAQLAFGSEEPPPAGRAVPPKSGPLPAPAEEFDADVTGVRSVSSPPVELVEEPLSSPRPPSILTPQVSRLQLADAGGGHVIDVIGEAQRFAPATFVALLDSSLKL